MRHPRLASHGEGERVGLWNAAMLQDPAAGRDVPADVAVAEHAPVAGDERRHRQDEDREEQLVEEAVALGPDQRPSGRGFARVSSLCKYGGPPLDARRTHFENASNPSAMIGGRASSPPVPMPHRLDLWSLWPNWPGSRGPSGARTVRDSCWGLPLNLQPRRGKESFGDAPGRPVVRCQVLRNATKPAPHGHCGSVGQPLGFC